MKYYLLCILLLLGGVTLIISYEKIFSNEDVESNVQPDDTGNKERNSTKEWDKLQNRLDDVESQLEEIHRDQVKHSRGNGSMMEKGIMGGGFVLFLILACWLFRLQRQLNQLKEQIGRNSSRKIEKTIKDLQDQLQQLQCQIKQIQNSKQTPTQKEEQPKTVEWSSQPDTNPTPPQSIPPQSPVEIKEKIIFAQPKAGKLQMASMKNSQYYKIVCAQDGRSGTFELVNDPKMVEMAIRNKEDIIDPLCETQGSAQTARSIRPISPGQATTEDGVYWKVTTKAKIEFIS